MERRLAAILAADVAGYTALIGASAAGFLIMVEALTGSATLGLALALVQRRRDIARIAWGFWLAWRHGLKPGTGKVRP